MLVFPHGGFSDATNLRAAARPQSGKAQEPHKISTFGFLGMCACLTLFPSPAADRGLSDRDESLDSALHQCGHGCSSRSEDRYALMSVLGARRPACWKEPCQAAQLLLRQGGCWHAECCSTSAGWGHGMGLDPAACRALLACWAHSPALSRQPPRHSRRSLSFSPHLEAQDRRQQDSGLRAEAPAVRGDVLV